MIKKLLCIAAIALLGSGAMAGETSADGVDADNQILIADNRRQERRGGRQDRRDDKQDCRQEEGLVGDDKRDCKQDSRGEGDDQAEADTPEGDA